MDYEEIARTQRRIEKLRAKGNDSGTTPGESEACLEKAQELEDKLPPEYRRKFGAKLEDKLREQYPHIYVPQPGDVFRTVVNHPWLKDATVVINVNSEWLEEIIAPEWRYDW